MKILAAAIFVLAGLSGCASKSIRNEVLATVVFDRSDIVELKESFKDIEGEKNVGLSKLGQAHCMGPTCSFPIKASGQSLAVDASQDKVEVQGTLAVNRASLQLMIDQLEQARNLGKEQVVRKGNSKLSCYNDKCTLSFLLPDRAVVSTEKLLH